MRRLSPMRTPTAKVRALGSAKSGTRDFVAGRLTGLANALATPPFLVVMIGLRDADHRELVATFASPIAAMAVLLFLVTAAVHMKTGMQVVIEDYVHHEDAKLALLALNALFCYALGAAGAFAVIRLALGG